jgi:hypothetical protein
MLREWCTYRPHQHIQQSTRNQCQDFVRTFYLAHSHGRRGRERKAVPQRQHSLREADGDVAIAVHG